MPALRKTLVSIAMIVTGISSYFAQEPFTENLNWISTSTVNSAQSPVYNNSNCQGIFYTLSSSSGLGFRYETGAANGSGVIVPGNTGNITSIPISIAFNTSIQNLSIHIKDLDEDNQHNGGGAEEYLTGFNPSPSSVQSTGNPIFLTNNEVTPYDNSSSENNNTAGWIHWTGTLSSLTFTYWRQGGTYEFVIDSIKFECSCPDPIVHHEDTLICPNTAASLNTTFNSADSYLWNTNSSTSTISVNSPGNYWVKSYTAGCWNIDSFTVAAIAVPALNFGNDTTICTGESFVLTVPTTLSNVMWQDGSTNYSYLVDTTGYYNVSATYQTCLIEQGISVIQQSYPVSNLDSIATICSGETYIAEVFCAGCSYLWSTGSINSSITIDQAGTYSVALSNGCITVDSVQLHVTALPPNPLLIDTIICEGSTISFSPAVLYSDVSYLWWNGSTEPDFMTSQNGVYWLQSLQDGCTRVDTVALDYYPTLAGNITYDSTIIKCEGSSILIGITTSSDLIDINWSNSSTTDYIAIHEAGVYGFTVSTPCEAKYATITVTEEQCYCNVYLPNAFTPDGNMYNNVFQAKYDCPFDSFELLIFNRWGELLYSSTNPDDYWDGTFREQPVQDGVYVYKLMYTSATTSTYKELNGHVSVLR